MEGGRSSKKVPRPIVLFILLTMVFMLVDSGASAFPRTTTPAPVTQPRTQQRRRSSFQLDTGSNPGSNNYSSVQNCSPIRKFKPHIDSTKIFPTLGFTENWLRTGNFWETNLEGRYSHYYSTERRKRSSLPLLKVFVIPHSHNDPGWLQTFESYYYRNTRATLNNLVTKMSQYRSMTFIWSEISFLAKWWEEDASREQKEQFNSLLKQGRLEIVTGGWVMSDEATVSLDAFIDQLIEGHQWVCNNLGGYRPKAAWSIDPFGHSGTVPHVLKLAGINEGMVIQRIHYGWKKWLADNQNGDFEWVPRWDVNKEHSILCHQAPFALYSTKHSCGPDTEVCLNFDFRDIPGEWGESCGKSVPITAKNVKERAELLLGQYERTASLYPHNVVMVNLGDDFRFDYSAEWDQQYQNYMKLFEYINANRNVYNAEVKFGTVSDYFQAVGERVAAEPGMLPTFTGDFFPYADVYAEKRPSYWTGFYSTRPYYKRFYRRTENELRSAEILYALALNSARQNGRTAQARALENLYAKLVTARRWLALFAHHDGTTGTSRLYTMLDYLSKLYEAAKNSREIQASAAENLLNSGVVEQVDRTSEFTNNSTFEESDSHEMAPQRSASAVHLRTSDEPLQFDGNQSHRVVLFNSLGAERTEYVKVLVDTPTVKVEAGGSILASQVNPVICIRSGVVHLSDKSYELVFLAKLPQLSLSTFIISAAHDDETLAQKAEVICPLRSSCVDPGNVFNITVGNSLALVNDRIHVGFNPRTYLLSELHIRGGMSARVKQSFVTYSSGSGGAYILRPDRRSERELSADGPNVFIKTVGIIAQEMKTFQGETVATTTRILSANSSAPSELKESVFLDNKIDLGDRSDEVFMRFQTDLENSKRVQRGVNPPVFYTDQNGFTIEKRIQVEGLGLEGNMYPANTMAFLQDEAKQLRFSVLVDHAQGLTSFGAPYGRLQVLMERRTPNDDRRGMSQGVTDNRPTISSYLLLLEKFSMQNQHDYRLQLPTMKAQRLSHALNAPASLFYASRSTTDSFVDKPSVHQLLSQPLPSDSHLLKLRAVSQNRSAASGQVELPSQEVLLVMQKLGFNDCPQNVTSKAGFFEGGTSLAGLNMSIIQPVQLTGISAKDGALENATELSQLTAKRFDISSYKLTFI